MSSRTTLTGSVPTILAISLLSRRAGVGTSGGEGLATRSTNVCCYDRTAGARHRADWSPVRREEGLRRFGSLISQIVGELHNSGRVAATFGSCGRGGSGQLVAPQGLGWRRTKTSAAGRTILQSPAEKWAVGHSSWHADATGMRDTRWRSPSAARREKSPIWKDPSYRLWAWWSSGEN